MKKGLGSIPKGLAWINSKKTPIKQSEKIKKNSIELVDPIKTSQKGLHAGWTRATFIIKQDHCQKLKALAYWDRKTVKELIQEALHSYLKNKRVKSMPLKK
jgi:hypothetical protein